MTVLARWLRPWLLFPAAGLFLAAVSVQAQDALRTPEPPRNNVPLADSPDPLERSLRAPGAPLPFQMNPDGESLSPPPAAGTRPPVVQLRRPISTADRPILPFASLLLTGEIDSHAWTVFLTKEQAEGQTRLAVRFTNSIVVVPEESWLRIEVNGQAVLETRIFAAENARTVQAEVESGVLKPGTNLIRIQARQSHRVDCSPQATYELWTRIFSEGTGFSFSNARAGRIVSLADLPAVGAGADGRTKIHLIDDLADPSPGAREAALEAIQQVALIGRFAHPVVSVTPQIPDGSAFGELALVVAPFDAVEDRLGFLPDGIGQQAIFRVLPADVAGMTTVLVSGPTLESIRTALDRSVQQQAQQSADDDVIETSAWWSPDVPVFSGSAAITFAELGIPSEEFTGRRFQTRFMVGLEPDFYAAAYGQATLLIDAAFASEALPESRFHVYVNDQIASTLQIRARGGTLYAQQPITIPLKNFSPGINEIRLEAIVTTSADTACAAGTTTGLQPRFALFDTTEFRLPDYARISRRPDLAPFAAGGFPYAENQVTAISLGDDGPASLAAAGTINARLAMLRGRPFPLTVANTAAQLAATPALIIGPVNSFAPGILSQVGISETLRESWQPTPRLDDQGGEPDFQSEPFAEALRRDGEVGAPTISRFGTTGDLQAEWRGKVAPSTWRSAIDRIENWLRETFDITLSSFRFGMGDDSPATPPEGTDLLIAQGPSFDAQHAWTVFTAPDAENLGLVAAEISTPTIWRQIAGRMTAFDTASRSLTVTPVSNFTFVATSPLTPRNLRMIAANWLSENIMTYALLIGGSCILLGISTSLILRRVGRTR